jgi:hypothetical protein
VGGPAILRGDSWRFLPKVSGRKFPFPRLLFATCPPRPISTGPWGSNLDPVGMDGSAPRGKTNEQGRIVPYAWAGAWSPSARHWSGQAIGRSTRRLRPCAARQAQDQPRRRCSPAHLFSARAPGGPVARDRPSRRLDAIRDETILRSRRAFERLCESSPATGPVFVYLPARARMPRGQEGLRWCRPSLDTQPDVRIARIRLSDIRVRRQN